MALKDKIYKTKYEEDLNQQMKQSPLFVELFNHTLAQIEQQRLNDSMRLKESNEQLKKRIKELESQNELWEKNMSQALSELKTELKDATVKQFKATHSAEFVKERQKWHKEQGVLQAKIIKNLKIQLFLTFCAFALYPGVILFFVFAGSLEAVVERTRELDSNLVAIGIFGTFVLLVLAVMAMASLLNQITERRY